MLCISDQMTLCRWRVARGARCMCNITHVLVEQCRASPSSNQKPSLHPSHSGWYLSTHQFIACLWKTWKRVIPSTLLHYFFYYYKVCECNFVYPIWYLGSHRSSRPLRTAACIRGWFEGIVVVVRSCGRLIKACPCPWCSCGVSCVSACITCLPVLTSPPVWLRRCPNLRLSSC